MDEADLKLHEQLIDWALREADDVRCQPGHRGSHEHLIRTLAPEVVRLREVNALLLEALNSADIAAYLSRWKNDTGMRFIAWRKIQDALALVGKPE